MSPLFEMISRMVEAWRKVSSQDKKWIVAAGVLFAITGVLIGLENVHLLRPGIAQPVAMAFGGGGAIVCLAIFVRNL